MLNKFLLLLFIGSLAACKPKTGLDSEIDSASELQNPLSAAQLIANSLQIKYQVISNRSDEQCDEKQTEGLCFQGKISLMSPVELNTNDWQIYFSNMAPIQMEESALFDIKHINGDLHSISPTKQFIKFSAKQNYEIPFRAGFWHLSQTDMMPNYYVVVEDEEPILIKSTVPKIVAETGLESLSHSIPLTLEDHHFKRTLTDNTQPATAQWLYQENKPNFIEHNVQYSILPSPKSVKMPKMAGSLDLSKGMNVVFEGINRDGVVAAIERLTSLGLNENEQGVSVAITKNESLAVEGYQLAISPNGIDIQASTEQGAFYALQSIASLIMPNSNEIPFMMVADEPRFEFRGMHVDVSRNFKSKQFIMQVLDQMAAYKLNKFHFHLADDEGWRVEIPDLPELTQVGAFRCHDLTEQTCLLPQLGSGPNKESSVNGYYTTEDYLEILQYATERHIQVIPSMDMPGHSRAAIKSMAARFNNYMAQGKTEQAKQYLLHDIEDTTKYSSVQFYNDNTINACMDSSYVFINKVVDELKLLHAKGNNPLTKYHLGADETAGAWINSSACKQLLTKNVTGIDDAEDIAAYFIERVSNILAGKGIEAAGWNDGMGHTKKERMPEHVQSNAWSPLTWDGHLNAHEQANRGWDVVLSTPDALYFDFPYEADANERGYYWAARRINSKKVFSMMPENLPVHAEFWRDREENPYAADNSTPLNKGVTFHGIQGQLWSETVRTDQQASYMIFPRLYALAERAWHKADWEMSYDYERKSYSQTSNYFSQEREEQRELDWQQFANHLANKTLVKAELQNVFYRLPTPGAKVEQGVLTMNNLYPGLPMEYQQDGKWQRYHKPVNISVPVRVRTTSSDGKRKGRDLIVN